jgi:CRP/FNR family cyclic AMP-dependent transcriptional regulator
MTTINIFRNAQQRQTFEPGQTIFSVGDAGKAMFGVIDGAVDIIVRGQKIETVEAGSVFGEMALIDGEARSADAVAASPCELAIVDLDEFNKIVRHNPFFAIQLMRLLTERLRRASARL